MEKSVSVVSHARRTLLAALLGAMPLAPSAAQQAPKTLYQRLGGYDAIALVTDDFVGRLAGDPRFARFFAGLSTDSKIRLRQHVVDQLCQVAGGPCFYTGRTMKVSHSGLGITGAEWDAAAGHLSASLDKYHVPAKEKGEVIAAVVKLRPDIVEK